MPGSKPAGRKPPIPTWAEWSAMHWRERARVRRQLAQHGLEPPTPPPTFQLPLSAAQVKQLERLAKLAQVSRDEYAAYVLGRHLERKSAPPTKKRRPSRQKEATHD